MKSLNLDFLGKAWIAILLGAGAILTLIFFQFTADDSYITFRHSLNLATQGVLSWNLHGPREEAFTNPLYVLLGMIGIKLGIKPELPIKIISLGLFFWWLKRALTMTEPASRAKRILVASFFLFCIPAYIHAYSGLETLTFAYLLFEYLACGHIGRPKDLLIALLILLCRPEGALFVLASLTCMAVKPFWAQQNHHQSDKSWIIPTLLVGLCTLAIIGYKINYFADFFPNTFYAKSGKSIDAGSILENLKSSACWLGLAILVFEWQKPKKLETVKYCGFAIIFLVYLRSELIMNYADRFWFQLFWPLIIYSLASNPNIESIASFFSPGKLLSSFSSSRSTILTTASLGWIASGIVGSPGSFAAQATYFGRAVRAHANLGQFLNSQLPKDATIYLGDAGLVPYYSNRMTYDLNSLGTKQIAREGVTTKFLESKSPDVLILYASACSATQTRSAQHPKELAFIKAHRYEYLGGFAWQGDYCLTVFAKPQIAADLKNKDFLQRQSISLLNTRGQREGFLEDIALSYRYLLTPGNDLPSMKI